MTAGNPTTKELMDQRSRWMFKAEHLVRHSISGCIVFLLGVCADVLISHHYTASITHKGLLLNGGMTTNINFMTRILPTNGESVAFGISENGQVFWFIKK